MFNSDLYADISEPERRRIGKKMSKAQLQLALIKKKRCDATALLIVERLLEPSVDAQWLLQNLRHINKCHMEDVIQERAIVKLCGYVLCSETLTVVFKQRYRISTKNNKVYDISRRKNFCSSSCYGACCYLLEQMLSSPLWMREKEEIPVFKLLSLNQKLRKSLPGDEVFVNGTDIHLDEGIIKASNEGQTGEMEKETPTDRNHATSLVTREIASLVNQGERNAHNKDFAKRTIRSTCGQHIEEIGACSRRWTTEDAGILHHNFVSVSEQDAKLHQPTECDAERMVDESKSFLTEQVGGQPVASGGDRDATRSGSEEGSNSTIHYLKRCNEMRSAEREESGGTVASDESKKEKCMDDNKVKVEFEGKLSTRQSGQITSPLRTPVACHERGRSRAVEQCDEAPNIASQTREPSTRCRRYLQKSSSDPATCAFLSLATRVEQSLKEWFTDETLCLLQGDVDAKNKLSESLTRIDGYAELCKKLNKIQLEEERERADLLRDSLKPVPHFSVLREEAKRMELKVSAFYKGSTTTEIPHSIEGRDANENDAVLPLTDARAPKALRRRIFLDKLHKVLPDLLRTLCGNVNVNVRPPARCVYDGERCTAVKTLVSTFSLSATNITFKTAEWTLVGLVIIKMLSVMDCRLKTSLASEQAVMYISMILMSYKLDVNYLDRLIIELTNNPSIFQ